MVMLKTGIVIGSFRIGITFHILQCALCNKWQMFQSLLCVILICVQEDTKVRIQSVLQELCGEDCKLEIFQEDNSDQIIVSGKYVEG